MAAPWSTARPRLVYAPSTIILPDMVKAGDIKSAAGRVKWAQTLEHHLIPAFGPLLLDRIRHADAAP